jgi:SAM-dependent methyltransferase
VNDDVSATGIGEQGQGAHPDPLDPRVPRVDPAGWSARERALRTSPEMAVFSSGLIAPGTADARAGVLDDLSSYSGLTPDECVRRCVDWERWSVTEWQSGDRSTPDGLRDFYRTTQSWAFDLLWYAYLQDAGLRHPVSVAIAVDLGAPVGRRHLDLGAGAGATGHTFGMLGFDSWMADVSTTLLDFVRHRFERRGLTAPLIDLNTSNVDDLPADATGSRRRWDVVTAIDVLAHVDDLDDLYRRLHRSMSDGGLLYANFDVRPSKEGGNAWHLHDDELRLRFQLHRAGFEPVASIDGMVVKYRRVDTTGIAHTVRWVRDLVLLRSPLRPAVRWVKRRLGR